MFNLVHGFKLDLMSRVSLGGGGGGGGGVSVVIGGLNRYAQNHGSLEGYNPRDPQGVWGRPDFNQGDAYSGNDTYGGADGR